MFSYLAKAESQLPFLYLNQYFNYDIVSASEITISDKSFDFKKFIISSEDKNIVFNLESLDRWLLPGSKLVFKNAENISLGQKRILKDKFIYRILKPEDAVSVCLVSSSVFSEIQFCKTISTTDTTELKPQVSANGEPIDKEGTVVLKESFAAASINTVLIAGLAI